MSLQRHYIERLREAEQRAQTLTDEISTLLGGGATLDDDRIVLLQGQRVKEYEDINEYRAAKEADEKEAHMTHQQERDRQSMDDVVHYLLGHVSNDLQP